MYDNLKTVSISFLKKHGYLKPQQWQSGVVTWRRNGEKVASISIAVSTANPNPYVELDYSYNGNPVNYKVTLIKEPSNLGRGLCGISFAPVQGEDAGNYT